MISLASLALASALAAPPERPHLTPWVVVRPEATAPPAAGPAPGSLSANAPGLLVEVRAAEVGRTATPEGVRRLFAEARAAGRRAGLLVELPEVKVPENAREAEAVTADSLVPGLGALLASARDADLFVLSLPDLSGEVRSRRWLLMKAAAIARSVGPTARIAVLFHQPAGGGLFPPGAQEILSEEAAAFVDLLGLDLDDASTTPEAVRQAADGLSFARPLLVTAPQLADAGALVDLAARFSTVDAPVVAGKRPTKPVLLSVILMPEARRSGGDRGQARGETAGDGEADDAVESEREVGSGVRAGGGDAGVPTLVLEEADRCGRGARVRAGAHRSRGEAARGGVLRADFRGRATATHPCDADWPAAPAAPVGPSRVLTLPPSVRVSLATGATDMRRSVDGLRALVLRHGLGDPYSGHLFVFRNRRGDRLKILVWDRSGFWVLYKRLEKGTFAWPETSEAGAMTIQAGDLALLLCGIDPARTKKRTWYERAA
ncbi:MAG: IS66 family insertion sequence element accessory protein TnpB [Thermoanaerobaculia bacterium]|jgi:transposase|nr:IS66 family insertion sequence element accessory protein TnpB [Thermoanaerobaculia bacterium]